ncbi:MAG: hypothetical protein DMF58_20990 [Acidobacteria bacterium]|nr:MAG: hypothetical protein DMF58_20990 [Acidobacteriota bacterium]
MFGKFGDPVTPVTYALPALSIAMSVASSTLLPPMNVEYTSDEPPEFSFETNTSRGPPPNTGCKAFAVGKSVDPAKPATYAAPLASTAIPKPRSSPVPPR